MIFDVLGVVDFLRARYGDALVNDVIESHVRNAPNDFTIIELKLIIPSNKGARKDERSSCACGNEGCTGG